MSDWPFGDLKMFHYGALLVDPPWYFKNFSAAGEAKNPVAHYPCMEIEDIYRLPVGDLAMPDTALVMWGTFPMMPQALETVRRWGFQFKTGGAWAKQSSTGNKLAFGPGYILRSAAEFYIIATIGSPRLKSKSIRNLILAPVREHSRKPDQMHEDIEALFDGPYLELFARAPRAGWSSWGNQINKFGGSDVSIDD